MKAVIIGASKEALHTIEKAHEHGLMVTALDGNPKAAGLEAADKALVVDISDEKATVLAVEREQPDFLLTVPIGRYLTTVGAVNDALKLPGISRQTAVLCTDKLRFHQKLQAENLRECSCYGIGKKQDELRGDEIFKRIEAEGLPLSFPAILKPRFGSGSRGIHIVENMEELKGALREMGEESCVLEECVPGAEYGVDGAVVGNEFQMILLRKKENTPLPVRQAVAYFSVLPTDPIYEQIQEYVKNIAVCLELKLNGNHLVGRHGSHGECVVTTLDHLGGVGSHGNVAAIGRKRNLEIRNRIVLGISVAYCKEIAGNGKPCRRTVGHSDETHFVAVGNSDTGGHLAGEIDILRDLQGNEGEVATVVEEALMIASSVEESNCEFTGEVDV